MLIYYFSTEVLAASEGGERCNEAPYWSQFCVEAFIVLVSMSHRDTAKKNCGLYQFVQTSGT